MMLIDPPSPFSSLEDWTAFRKEMERVVAAYPDEADAVEYLKIAREKEAELKG